MSDQQKDPTSGCRHGQNSKHRIEGDVRVDGQIKTNLPPDLVEEYKASNRESSAREYRTEIREKRRFVVEIVTLGFVALVAVISLVQVWLARRSTDAAVAAAAAAQKSVDSARESAYQACLSTQATQLSFLQLQSGSRDSVTVANASIQQARANLAETRSHLILIADMPTPGDIQLHPTDLTIPFHINNIGKYEMTGLAMKVSAVLVSPKETISFNESALISDDVPYAPANSSIPAKPEDPRYRGVTFSVPAHKAASNDVVPLSDVVAQSFLSSAEGVFAAVYGHMRYRDLVGTHYARFCVSIFAMKPGTSGSDLGKGNYEACKKYNYERDYYEGMPKVETSIASIASLTPVECILPKRE